MRPSFYLLVSAALLFLAGCSTTDIKNPYAEAFEAERIRSILVVPAVNRSLDVEAPWVLLSTLPEVLAETGYYVFPVNTVKVVLEHEGLYDASEAHALAPEQLANMFEADGVLYITIHDWESEYIFIDTTTKITLSYRFVSRSGRELWKNDRTIVKKAKDRNDGGGNLLGNLIVDAINAASQRAKPNYRPLAQQANNQAFTTGTMSWPEGPYLIEARQKEN